LLSLPKVCGRGVVLSYVEAKTQTENYAPAVLRASFFEKCAQFVFLCSACVCCADRQPFGCGECWCLLGCVVMFWCGKGSEQSGAVACEQQSVEMYEYWHSKLEISKCVGRRCCLNSSTTRVVSASETFELAPSTLTGVLAAKACPARPVYAGKCSFSALQSSGALLAVKEAELLSACALCCREQVKR